MASLDAKALNLGEEKRYQGRNSTQRPKVGPTEQPSVTSRKKSRDLSADIRKPAHCGAGFPELLRTLGVGAAAVWWRVLGTPLVDFFAALGARFGALLALLVQLVLGTEEFNEGLLGSITLLETGAHDAQIAAGAISITWGHRI